MKMKVKFTLLLMLCVSYSFAQTDSISANVDTMKPPTIEERLANIEQRLEVLDIDLSLKSRYKMYSTENMYNLLRLDTKTGRIWQVQWYLDDSSKEGTWVINNEDLSNWRGGYGSNSFELYPTQNMYQFILIDKTDGRMWHVQWGIGDKKRWIRRIHEW